jgi:hypothetical protein
LESKKMIELERGRRPVARTQEVERTRGMDI